MLDKYLLDIDKILDEIDCEEYIDDELVVPSRETLEEYLSHEEQIVIHITTSNGDEQGST